MTTLAPAKSTSAATRWICSLRLAPGDGNRGGPNFRPDDQVSREQLAPVLVRSPHDPRTPVLLSILDAFPFWLRTLAAGLAETLFLW